MTALKRKKGNIDLLSDLKACGGGAGLSDEQISKVRLFHLNVVVTIRGILTETLKRIEQNSSSRRLEKPGLSGIRALAV